MSGEPVDYNSVHQRKFINSGADFDSELKKVTSGVGLAGGKPSSHPLANHQKTRTDVAPSPDTDRQDVFRVEAAHLHTQVPRAANRSNR